VPAPSNLPWNVAGPPKTPASRKSLVSQTGEGGRSSGYVAVALTDGVYIASGSPALTDAPLWVNISEEGTW
jgi:hypothetical protein